jgi:small-conductance mechanosensitive channel
VEKERKQFEEQLSTIEQQQKTRLDEISERHERELREAAESRGTLAAALLEANAQAAEAVSQSRVAQDDVRRLTEEVAQARKAAIESRRRQVERAVQFAKKVESFAHDSVAMLLGLVIFLLTYFGASASGTNAALPIAIGTGLLAAVAFWKVPERFFGPIVHKVRDEFFRMQIRKYGLHDELARFEIDWEKPLVRTRETGP